MSLNNTPSSERIHIGIFGKRNAGKSSIINALTGQDLSIVSDIRGTTTDPVLKAMELLPLGAVVMIDTPGIDDEGELGALRVRKAHQMLNKTDIAVLVVDGTAGMTREDDDILDTIQAKSIPCIVVLNKADLIPDPELPAALAAIKQRLTKYALPVIQASAASRLNIQELKERIASLVPAEDTRLRIVGDLLKPSDLAVLVVPIDKAAPKGRLILPQQQTIRDILEAGAVSVVTRDAELRETLASLGKRPVLVITDSQAFEQVANIVPEDIPLTSFSILFARYKGSLHSVVDGARTLDLLENGDTILISEGCTHHRQCEDIGTVKLPNWIRKHTGKELNFEFTSGTEFPLDLQKYRLIIHCGGCTLNEREMRYRQKCAEDAAVPMTNYGTAIAYMKGILERSIAVFQSKDCFI
ncbi:MAG: [FeFe] hydrogenase H-cluster maturation GTPase HydF [Dorea sp.]|jgi:[FeFe] hydrogenase H-cluster maturation GTPase HydF|nr:[FeFe] hydrogenase H-cluster maturation GTPase HydF [Dorea sp.]